MGLGRPFYSQKPSPIYKASVVLDGFSGSLITSVGFITNRKEQGRVRHVLPFWRQFPSVAYFLLTPYWPGFKSSEVAVGLVGMFWRTMSLISGMGLLFLKNMGTSSKQSLGEEKRSPKKKCLLFFDHIFFSPYFEHRPSEVRIRDIRWFWRLMPTVT